MKKKNYIYGLDAYRALAIIGVTLFHIFPNKVMGGYLGVCMFFVLTGFLLPVTSRKRFDILTYLKKRIKRIYPSLIIVIFVTCGICLLTCAEALSGRKTEILSILLGYNNWWQIRTNADYFARAFNTSPFTHFWFLGIELQYYLIFPFIWIGYVFYKKKKQTHKFLCGLLVTSLISALLMIFLFNPKIDVTPIYYGTHTRIFSLLFGSLLGFVYTNRKRSISVHTKNIVNILFLISLVVTGISFFTIDGQNPLLYRGGMLAMTLLFVFQVYVISNPSFSIGRILEMLPIQWIGKHSFSIYLWQYPVIFLFTQWKFNEFFGYQIVEIALILLLAYALDALLQAKINLKNIPVLVASGATMICVVLGGYGVLTASNERQDSINELQKGLEDSANTLDEKNKQSLEAYLSDDTTDLKNSCSKEGVFLVGDSILLKCSEALFEELPGCFIDAAVNRQMEEALYICQQYSTENVIHDTIVIVLGTNGPIYYDDVVPELLDFFGDEKDIFWVNTQDPIGPWCDANNSYMEDLTKERPNLHVIDWLTIYKAHPEYLEKDMAHPNEEGAVIYAKMIRKAIESTPSIRANK